MDKQHIIDEIKRTARENGGIPLGRQRFYKETGIRNAAVLGRYWARWGDALCEAGFEPSRLQGSINDDSLIESFIGLIRELGRWPTMNELKLKTRTKPGFPSHNTFARFGSKENVRKRILAYCSGRDGYQDVATICATVLIPSAMKRAAVEPVVEFGFVYLMKSGRYYKLGRTNHLGGRERDLAIQMPEKPSTVHSIRTDDPAGIEAYWHNRFKATRKNGEWFDLKAADVAAFKRRTFM